MNKKFTIINNLRGVRYLSFIDNNEMECQFSHDKTDTIYLDKIDIDLLNDWFDFYPEDKIILIKD